VAREYLVPILAGSAALLTLVSVFLVAAYAGPEPFFNYRRADAFTHIGIATAVIALWGAWSLAILGLVISRVFSVKWLAGLLLAAIASFYLHCCPTGYLDDLENWMLSPEQQRNIELPAQKS
jgi:hypothetical protein